MIRRYELLLAGDLAERQRDDAFAARGDHDPVTVVAKEFGAGGAEPGRQNPVCGRGRPATLQVAQNGQPGLDARQLLQFMREVQRVAHVILVERFQARGRLFALAFGLGVFLLANKRLDRLRFRAGHGALGDGHDAEPPAALGAAADRVGHDLHRIGDLRNQDHIRAAGDSGPQRQPSGTVAHRLHDDDPVVAGGGGVEAVDRLCGDLQCGVEAEGDVRAKMSLSIVLGKVTTLRPSSARRMAFFCVPSSADADHRAETVPLVGGDRRRDHVLGLVADGHLVRLVAAGSQDGAAVGQDPGEGWDRRLMLDGWYVDNWSLRLDAEILFQTVLYVIRRHGVETAPSAVMDDLDVERAEAVRQT